jgi:sugar phosphate isomerase/epimerase
MRLGVSSYAFGWAVAAGPAAPRPFTPDTLLGFAVAQRVPVIQFGDHVPLHLLGDADLDAFAARARAAGIAVETGARGLTAAHLPRFVAVSQRLGARVLRFVIDARDYEPTAAEVTAIVRDALPALRAAGVTLALENHDRFPCAVLRGVVDAVGDPHVGICLDTANSLGAGEGIGEVLRELAPVCVNLHVKDYAITRLPYLMGFTVEGRALGTGQLPLARTLAAVAAGGRCTTAVVETWVPPETDHAATLAKELRWAETSVAALRTALAASSA